MRGTSSVFIDLRPMLRIIPVMRGTSFVVPPIGVKEGIIPVMRGTLQRIEAGAAVLQDHPRHAGNIMCEGLGV